MLSNSTHWCAPCAACWNEVFLIFFVFVPLISRSIVSTIDLLQDLWTHYSLALILAFSSMNTIVLTLSGKHYTVAGMHRNRTGEPDMAHIQTSTRVQERVHTTTAARELLLDWLIFHLSDSGHRNLLLLLLLLLPLLMPAGGNKQYVDRGENALTPQPTRPRSSEWVCVCVCPSVYDSGDPSSYIVSHGKAPKSKIESNQEGKATEWPLSWQLHK